MARTLALIGGLEFASFLLATVNFRACAKGHVGKTVATDALIAGVGFFLVRLVAEARSPAEMAVYVAGACAGSALGMWLTKKWEHRS